MTKGDQTYDGETGKPRNSVREGEEGIVLRFSSWSVGLGKVYGGGYHGRAWLVDWCGTQQHLVRIALKFVVRVGFAFMNPARVSPSLSSTGRRSKISYVEWPLDVDH